MHRRAAHARPRRCATVRSAPPPLLCSADADAQTVPTRSGGTDAGVEWGDGDRLAYAVIEQFWTSTATGRYRDTAGLFAADAVYYDTLYARPFEGIDVITGHLHNMETAIPASIRIVVDAIVADDVTLKAAARWHAETPAGKLIPFSRGASTYSLRKTVDEETGRARMQIEEAWDFPETPLKVAGIVLPVFRAASAVLQWVSSWKTPRGEHFSK